MTDVKVSNSFDSYDDESRRPRRSKSQYRRNYGQTKDERDDRLILMGVVEEALPGTWFKIIINDGSVSVLATLSGKMRQNHIQILPGDKVTVEVSPYDTSRGRITRRN